MLTTMILMYVVPMLLNILYYRIAFREGGIYSKSDQVYFTIADMLICIVPVWNLFCCPTGWFLHPPVNNMWDTRIKLFDKFLSIKKDEEGI
jgi:hypothetical protein